MPPNTRRTAIKPLNMPKRPGMDIVAARQAAQFPGVGVTLPHSQYQNGGGGRGRRSAGLGTAPPAKKSRFSRLRGKVTLKRVVVTLAIIIALIGAFVGGKFL